MRTFDIHALTGVLGTAGTIVTAHWSDLGAGFAGLGTGCYMIARAWHVWNKRKDDKAPPLCKNFDPGKPKTQNDDEN